MRLPIDTSRLQFLIAVYGKEQPGVGAARKREQRQLQPEIPQHRGDQAPPKPAAANLPWSRSCSSCGSSHRFAATKLLGVLSGADRIEREPPQRRR
jgi:hypothetical protein